VDAVDIAALVQALAADLLAAPRHWGDEYGEFIDVDAVGRMTLRESLGGILDRLEDNFVTLGAAGACEPMRDRVRSPATGAIWLRETCMAGRALRGVA
jgi:hypothetical protein